MSMVSIRILPNVSDPAFKRLWSLFFREQELQVRRCQISSNPNPNGERLSSDLARHGGRKDLGTPTAKSPNHQRCLGRRGLCQKPNLDRSRIPLLGGLRRARFDEQSSLCPDGQKNLRETIDTAGPFWSYRRSILRE